MIDRFSPDGSDPLGIDSFAITGPDADFFDIPLFNAIASLGLDPGSDQLAFDLQFNPDALDLAGQTDFEATIAFTTDTGLVIPIDVSATTIPEPASATLLGVLAALVIRRRTC